MTDLSYEEEKSKLSCRINLHYSRAEKNIDDWIIDIIKPKEGSKILDLGCGTGKQVLMFAKNLNDFEIVGCDINEDLLNKAKENADKDELNASFQIHDLNDDLPFSDSSFDVVCSCFAIYYVSDAEKILREIKRVLKSRGKIFIAGPSPKNSIEFWNLCENVSGKKTPESCTIRKDRIHNDFIPFIKKLFFDVQIELFENYMNFENAEEVVKYYEASLLFKETVSSEEEGINVLNQLRKRVEKIISEEGVFKIRKEVYGILGFKQERVKK